MKKKWILLLLVTMLTMDVKSHSAEEPVINNNNEYYTLEEIDVCSASSNKSYMSYSTVTDRRSRQYKLIQELNITETGLLKDDYGFIAAALGSYYGSIGDRFKFTLDSGVELYVIKADAKSDSHTNGGCIHSVDASIIEFVIDEDKAGEYFGVSGNNLVLSGNFNNVEMFKGLIVKADKVTLNEDIIPDIPLSPFIDE